MRAHTFVVTNLQILEEGNDVREFCNHTLELLVNALDSVIGARQEASMTLLQAFQPLLPDGVPVGVEVCHDWMSGLLENQVQLGLFIFSSPIRHLLHELKTNQALIGTDAKLLHRHLSPKGPQDVK